MRTQIIILVSGILITVAFYLGKTLPNAIDTQNLPRQPHADTPSQPTITKDPSFCTPTFADGGGPYYQPNSPFRTQIVPPSSQGQPLTVTGRILLSDCQTPVPNAILDIWQANASGNYEDEWHRGRVTTDSQGNYKFQTIYPKGYGEGTNYRPPHIHFKVFVNNREIITSQMFFPDVKGRFEDAYIITFNQSDPNLGTHNIILPIRDLK